MSPRRRPSLCSLDVVGFLFLALLSIAPSSLADTTQERSEDDIGDVFRNYGLLVLFVVVLPVAYLYRAYTQPPSAASPENEGFRDLPSGLIGFRLQEGAIVSISMKALNRFSSLSASIAIYGAIVLSLILHYDQVTSTSCHVTNPLPSISSAVGYGVPERILFRFGILGLSWNALLHGYTMFGFFRSSLSSQPFALFMNACCFWFHTAENISLFVLAYISSTEHYEIHEKGFIFWVIFQTLKIGTHLYRFKKARGPSLQTEDARLWQWMKFLVYVDVVAFTIALPAFILHNSRCIPYLYALFSLCEYTLVGANILFNLAIMSSLPEDARVVVKRSFPVAQSLSIDA